MKLIRTRDKIENVLNAWKNQYRKRSPDYRLNCGHTVEQIEEQLKTLNLEKCSAKAVNSIIGNNSWTTQQCSECGKNRKELISFKGANICERCIEKAMELLDQG